MKIGDEVFVLLAELAGGGCPMVPDSPAARENQARLVRLLLDAGVLISTRYEYAGEAVRLTRDEILKLRQAVDIDDLGLLELESLVLYLLARENSCSEPVCELGSFLGGSTIILATGSRHAPYENRVVAVDDHEWHRHLAEDAYSAEAVKALPSTLEQFRENLKTAGVAEQVAIYVEDTVQAGREYSGTISLLFIDADHALEAVRADFNIWYPKVVPGGVIAFHDYGNSNWPDVQMVVDDVKDYFTEFTVYQTLAVGRKPSSSRE